MVSESQIEARFRRWCKVNGYLCLKLTSIYVGWPDRTVILPQGQIVFLEFKKPGGRVSVHQAQYISQLQQLGHRAEVVYSFERAVEVIEEVLHEGRAT